MKISVVIHTFNSEKYIERCVTSVADADEIIICDMHSSDKTVEIAEKHGCKVVYHENVGFAEPARNFANSQVTSDFFLILDSDEFASKGLINYLRDFVTKNESVCGVQIKYNNEVLGQVLNSYSKPGILRFFKRGKVNYAPFVHASPEVDGEIVSLPKSCKEYITHTMVDDFNEHILKWNYYTNLEVEKTIKNKKKKASVSKIIIRPIGEFIKLYFLKKGFTDGIRGYIFAIIGAHYKFVQAVKLWDYERKEALKAAQNENH